MTIQNMDGTISESNPLHTKTVVTGSNVEQTIGAALPSKANLIGISDGINIRSLSGNMEGTLLASAARTASINSPAQKNYNGKGVIVILDVTVASGTGGLQIKIYGVSPISGVGYQFNADPTAITSTGRYAYLVYPGASGGAAGNGKVNQATGLAMPQNWYTRVEHGDATSYTYSLGYATLGGV